MGMIQAYVDGKTIRVRFLNGSKGEPHEVRLRLSGKGTQDDLIRVAAALDNTKAWKPITKSLFYESGLQHLNEEITNAQG